MKCSGSACTNPAADPQVLYCEGCLDAQLCSSVSCLRTTVALERAIDAMDTALHLAENAGAQEALSYLRTIHESLRAKHPAAS